MSDTFDQILDTQAALREVLGPGADLPRKEAAELLRERLRRRGLYLTITSAGGLGWRTDSPYTERPTEAERAACRWFQPELIALVRQPAPVVSAGKPRRRRPDSEE